MKVKIIKGTLRKDGKEYSAGKSVDVDDKEAERLIVLGMAKKEEADTTGKPDEKTADDETSDNIADDEASSEADEQDEVQSVQTAKKGGKK